LFTSREDGHLVGVLWNPNNKEVSDKQLSVKLELPGESADYTVRTLLVDETHANPYRVWEMLGRERNPSRAQVELLRESSVPSCSYHDLNKADGARVLDIALDKNAVMLVEMIPVDDHSQEYYKLDKEFYRNFSI
jgi:xylan 1,4-beta-xylosidase